MAMVIVCRCTQVGPSEFIRLCWVPPASPAVEMQGSPADQILAPPADQMLGSPAFFSYADKMLGSPADQMHQLPFSEEEDST